MRFRFLLGCMVLAFACLELSACGGDHHPTTSIARAPTTRLLPRPPHRLARPAGRPNIVFVLTDDLSMNLLRFMPNVQAMERHGLTFENYFVSDSLCCPSRASIFTGNLPHDTHVFSNFGLEGGFREFYSRGEQRHTFNIALRRAGYRTAMMGKYLNGYGAAPGVAVDGSATAGLPPTYIPPGWNEWDVTGYGYREYDYIMNENGVLYRYGHTPPDYLTNVLTDRGVDFMYRSAAAGKPFFLELATFTPHSPYVPAPRDAHAFPGMKAPRPPSFDTLPTHAPRWLANHRPLKAGQIAQINRVFRLRARDVLSVDRMIGRIESALIANGIARNTYLVFSSDNGLHTGEYRLLPGKLTAFDTDIHVPLVVIGPGVPAGRRTTAMAENVDLAKTFAAIGRTTLPGDGHSLLSLIDGRHVRAWRNAVLVEHHGADLAGIDPDYQPSGSGSPRTYEAMRTRDFLYVEYDDGERELYDLRIDPFELHNIAGELVPATLTLLHRELVAMEQCHNGRQCWAAMHIRAAA